ncbi:DUF2075 domain-containing protein [Pseudoclavibacter sp. CFCC 11306]|uniref:DUF2075 domain-containing protein n=1 Tax=Pseudoclavibacter sp. CFCC 11306 TaxID=1564493 RepID=UPI0013016560|nr:DUF2075 domain-containing protein [Pseudoclavibacter sp. CFCC 11306]KAB1656978.1 DUF2075 domain-containing protein [Pseudoclavibacter sp. CFCC 11306]
MTDFDIEHITFDIDDVQTHATLNDKLTNWPVVYLIDGANAETNQTSQVRRRQRAHGIHRPRIYVGETGNALARMRQHHENEVKRDLEQVRVIIDETFNKSACLDLESQLIGWCQGDGTFQVLNRNAGLVDADYFDRETYRKRFHEIFERLRAEGVFTHSIPEIENSELFKLSPFKSLTTDQSVAIEQILETLSADRAAQRGSTIVVQGDPGTGKTIVAIYLIKLLRDIGNTSDDDLFEMNSLFSDFFAGEHREALQHMDIGIVVPQQSLRTSMRRVFKSIPNMREVKVLTPFDVGSGDDYYDLLLVDEAHRLGQRANQSSGTQNKKFIDINTKLFGEDDLHYTQLDWIRARSTNQILLIDADQTVRPSDLPTPTLRSVLDAACRGDRLLRLTSQLRVKGGSDYIEYVGRLLSDEPPAPKSFGDAYDLRFFDDLGEMHEEIRKRDAEVGLSRLVAGFAWPWNSKNDKSVPDIVEDGVALQWNWAQTDWIASPHAIDQVGSIHTVQGYELNYAGVIIGRDLQLDRSTGRLMFSRDDYYDKKGKENNAQLGITYSDEELLKFVRNIYRVLMTRGMLGTYVYVCDAELKERLKSLVPSRQER